MLDLPDVEKFARAQISRSSVADRITFVTSDFFADDLPPADLYNLGRILHDWSKEKILPLLSKIHVSLPRGGAFSSKKPS